MHVIAVLAAISGHRELAVEAARGTQMDEDTFAMLQVGAKSQLVKGSIAASAASKRGCEETYPPGIHLVQLPEVARQFLFFVPRETVHSKGGVPLVVTYHGWTDSPWYINKATGMSLLLEQYGWLGIFPFGTNANGTNGLGGPHTCCAEGCDEECCRNGLQLMPQDDTACGWAFDLPWHHGDGNATAQNDDLKFADALIEWAGKHTCTDTSKVFATGFSNGAQHTNLLGCYRANLFRAVAPMSGDLMISASHPLLPGRPPLAQAYPYFEASLVSCEPSRPISYISSCGTKDDESFCQETFEASARKWSEMNNCTGAGYVVPVSATTTCTQWSTCVGGNFVEYCKTVGISHEVMGHLRPDSTSLLRPGSDIDFPAHIMQKFSLLVNHSILFYGHPTHDELVLKESSFPRPQHTDHMYLRSGRLLGQDPI